MPPKSKVESSEHYAEIHELLLRGNTPRWISDYLKHEYNEIIGYSAIYNYQKKNIRIEEQTIEEVNRRAAERVVNENADTIEQISETTNAVIHTTATQLQGLLKVGANFPEDYMAMKNAVNDPYSRVSEKDVAEMSWKANKLSLEFIKNQETNVEVNIDNNLSGFVDDLEVLRFIDESEAEESNSK